MATSSSSPSTATDIDYIKSLYKQINSHEVSIAELSALPSSRKVYQKNGTIFFRTNVQQATVSEQKQLDTAKAKLQTLNLSGGN
ncbi:prefoldin chaperone subunit family protein [Tanacetum coccineum]